MDLPKFLEDNRAVITFFACLIGAVKLFDSATGPFGEIFGCFALIAATFISGRLFLNCPKIRDSTPDLAAVTICLVPMTLALGAYVTWRYHGITREAMLPLATLLLYRVFDIVDVRLRLRAWFQTR